jgi:hypothetical protein
MLRKNAVGVFSGIKTNIQQNWYKKCIKIILNNLKFFV